MPTSKTDKGKVPAQQQLQKMTEMRKKKSDKDSRKAKIEQLKTKYRQKIKDNTTTNPPTPPTQNLSPVNLEPLPEPAPTTHPSQDLPFAYSDVRERPNDPKPKPVKPKYTHRNSTNSNTLNLYKNRPKSKPKKPNISKNPTQITHKQNQYHYSNPKPPRPHPLYPPPPPNP